MDWVGVPFNSACQPIVQSLLIIPVGYGGDAQAFLAAYAIIPMLQLILLHASHRSQRLAWTRRCREADGHPIKRLWLSLRAVSCPSQKGCYPRMANYQKHRPPTTNGAAKKGIRTRVSPLKERTKGITLGNSQPHLVEYACPRISQKVRLGFLHKWSVPKGSP